MSKQIVISGNRILSYGEDCFLSLGGTVICPDTGKVYQNATIATVDALPSDIDSVGYEYHAGDFVPCAPFGIGEGNVAVVCGEDCKSIKDSGISFAEIKAAAAGVESGTYTGAATKYSTGSGLNTVWYSKGTKTLTFSRMPQIVIIVGGNSLGIILTVNKTLYAYNNASNIVLQTATVTVDANTISWTSDKVADELCMCAGVEYGYTAITK